MKTNFIPTRKSETPGTQANTINTITSPCTKDTPFNIICVHTCLQWISVPNQYYPRTRAVSNRDFNCVKVNRSTILTVYPHGSKLRGATQVSIPPKRLIQDGDYRHHYASCHDCAGTVRGANQKRGLLRNESLLECGSLCRSSSQTLVEFCL
jgi:hypothetical protein